MEKVTKPYPSGSGSMLRSRRRRATISARCSSAAGTLGEVLEPSLFTASGPAAKSSSENSGFHSVEPSLATTVLWPVAMRREASPIWRRMVKNSSTSSSFTAGGATSSSGLGLDGRRPSQYRAPLRLLSDRSMIKR